MNGNGSHLDLVVLDRDGVINQDSDRYIRSADDWIPIPGSLEAIARLNYAGFRVVVATNQSGLGRGYFNVDAVNAMHRKMRRELAVLGGQIEAVFFCPHAPESECRCRKPASGLLEDLGHRLGINLVGIPVIGDSYRDIQSAMRVGASPRLVLTGKGRSTLAAHRDALTDIHIHDDLASAVDALLAN